MASGLEFMMKSLGLNPEEIKQGVNAFVEMAKSMDNRLRRIENALGIESEENNGPEKQSDGGNDRGDPE